MGYETPFNQFGDIFSATVAHHLLLKKFTIINAKDKLQETKNYGCNFDISSDYKNVLHKYKDFLNAKKYCCF